MSASRIAHGALRSARASCSSHLNNVRYATTAMRMPAMSPTMTEGGIASWKKAEGEEFTAGDVLLEVETDKATIDVEAQDDGIMGKIVVQEGTSKIPVGQIIAMLAEQGDDLANIEVPKDLGPERSAEPSASGESRDGKGSSAKEESTKKSTKQESASASPPKSEPKKSTGHGHKEIKHPKPIFPSVSRLLMESDMSSEQIQKLKGTGKGGMLTKGDALLALGQIKNAFGSAEKINLDMLGPSGKRKSEVKEGGTGSTLTKKEEVLDGPALRRLILSGMTKATEPVKPIVPHSQTSLPLSSDSDFDSILAPYASLLPPPQPKVPLPSPEAAMDVPKKDEFAGLW